MTGVVAPNGSGTTREFNGSSQPTRITYDFATSSWPVTYDRGLNGELTSLSQWSGVTAWDYDSAQQLTTSLNPNSINAFDPAGGLDPTKRLQGAAATVTWSPTVMWPAVAMAQ